MSDEIKIEIVADADGVIKAVQKIGPAAKKAVKPLPDGLGRANAEGHKLGKTLKKVAGIAGGIALGAAFTNAIRELSAFNLKIAEVNTLLPKTNRVTKDTEARNYRKCYY